MSKPVLNLWSSELQCRKAHGSSAAVHAAGRSQGRAARDVPRLQTVTASQERTLSVLSYLKIIQLVDPILYNW
eukprot:1660213-Rhodomonas_salina.1